MKPRKPQSNRPPSRKGPNSGRPGGPGRGSGPAKRGGPGWGVKPDNQSGRGPAPASGERGNSGRSASSPGRNLRGASGPTGRSPYRDGRGPGGEAGQKRRVPAREEGGRVFDAAKPRGGKRFGDKPARGDFRDADRRESSEQRTPRGGARRSSAAPGAKPAGRYKEAPAPGASGGRGPGKPPSAGYSRKESGFEPKKKQSGKRSRETGVSGGHPRRAPERDDTVRKTLDRVLSRAGVGSRTVAAEWIREGRVRVNGRVVRDPEAWVDPENDRVQLDGGVLRPLDRVYVLLYKPRGYLCTREDPEGRATIYSLLTGMKSWAFNVGRLDRDTSGLLVLTNDTDLGELLTNPVYKMPKTYLVKAATVLGDEDLRRLSEGVMLSDGLTQPAEVTRLRDSEKYTHLSITIREGRNRQVRRMLEAVGSRVLKLVRTHIGPISIGKLQIGQHRPLSAEEVRTLKRLAEEAVGPSGSASGGESRTFSAKTSAAKRRMRETSEESSERWSNFEDD